MMFKNRFPEIIKLIGLVIPLLVLIILSSCITNSDENARQRVKFNSDWKFAKGDFENAQKVDFNDNEWRKLDLPHDWAIEGPFKKDAYYQMGYLPYEGTGWYRKSFFINTPKKKLLLEFDGVMMFPKVWVNGEFVGEWGFGYTSFALDISDHIKHGSENVIAVRVENLEYSSRWYPGSGIYRNVWLTQTNPIHIDHWGTFVTTPVIKDEKAKINIETTILNEGEAFSSLVLETYIVDSQGNSHASISNEIEIDGNGKLIVQQELEILNPEIWDIDNPNLYEAISLVKSGNKLIDKYRTPFGIRSFEFDANKGFSLNGRTLKIQGVNMHHDLGPLGSAINYRATERQLEILKEMGVNAIRTAHNPPSPEQLELCDKMGILVMDESFDEWRRTKLNVKNSYSILFDGWAEKDMKALVLRDRNHPSVIMWSTGNEVPELGTGKLRVTIGNTGDVMEGHYDQFGQLVTFEGWDETWYGSYDGKTLKMGLNESKAAKLAKKDPAPSLSGSKWDLKSFRGDGLIYHYDFLDDNDGKNSAKFLADICRELDPSRPVSSGIHLSIRLDQELMDIFDIGGFNYWHERIEDLHTEYPDKPLLVTEAAAMLSTRGEYFFPVERVYCGFEDQSMQISSYDLTNTCFGTLPDTEFKLQDDNPWLAGQFVWAGFDYHGEPDPYENSWPAHSSYFGIIDMCGFPKDRFYLYQSQWTTEPMVHLLPHWNWEGREGEKTPVYIYSNCASVELFVNGESKGVKQNTIGEYRFKWNDVIYQPGNIKAVGYDTEGRVLCEKEIKTAGKASKIVLMADREIINADGKDLSFITVKITDKDGNLCPKANNLVKFQIEGEGLLAAVGNGDPSCLESYNEPRRSVFNGLCLLIVKSTTQAGNINISASSDGLESSSLVIDTEPNLID
jgi:beta-galactosidase